MADMFDKSDISEIVTPVNLYYYTTLYTSYVM